MADKVQFPQELVENIIDRFSRDRRMLITCSLVASTWLARSRHHLFNRLTFTQESAERWRFTIHPDPDGVSNFVRTLTIQQGMARRWLNTKFLDSALDHFSSLRHVEDLSITWLTFDDFESGSLPRHFGHYGSSLLSLHLSYPSADYSALTTFFQLFPNLKDLVINTPDLRDDNPPLRAISATTPAFHHTSLNLIFFDEASSSFISHFANLDLRFSSISVSDCDFSSGFPLTKLFDASSLSLRHLELKYLTFSKGTDVSLLHCRNLESVKVGVFEEGRSPPLLFSLLSTLSSFHLTYLTIGFVAMPSPRWSEWKIIDTLLLQMVERCGPRPGPHVVLQTKVRIPGDTSDGRSLLPKYWAVGSVELRLNPTPIVPG